MACNSSTVKSRCESDGEDDDDDDEEDAASGPLRCSDCWSAIASSIFPSPRRIASRVSGSDMAAASLSVADAATCCPVAARHAPPAAPTVQPITAPTGPPSVAPKHAPERAPVTNQPLPPGLCNDLILTRTSFRPEASILRRFSAHSAHRALVPSKNCCASPCGTLSLWPEVSYARLLAGSRSVAYASASSWKRASLSGERATYG
mmetsp:Transcript_2716/g.5073  ORF Transcript_2716/g.5073 Transcript_2716/m.5073 type:complete len:205 (-) Transcript_2716:180-794(-)